MLQILKNLTNLGSSPSRGAFLDFSRCLAFISRMPNKKFCDVKERFLHNFLWTKCTQNSLFLNQIKTIFVKNFARNYERKIILGTSYASSMSRSSQLPTNPAYCIVGFYVMGANNMLPPSPLFEYGYSCNKITEN